MTTIPIHESKALYAALENPEALKQGPVFLEKDGQPTAVLLSMEEYRKLAGTAEREDWVAKELAPIKPEIEAYQKMLPELLKEHRGKWVAIHQGKVVAHGRNRAEVARLVVEKRYQPVYIEKVQEEERTADIPHLERTSVWEAFDEWRAGQLRQVEDERAAFTRLLPQLLKTHPGQFVAVHTGKVVDSDLNKPALARRIREQGYKPVYIHKATSELRIIEAPAPEVVRRA